ncbi:MAG: hypothetical protein WKF73_08070 [Nocardioidaceae bacterium]
MPEGHTLFRLAADLNAAFAGQPVEVTSPQGRFTDGAAAVDGRVLEVAESAGKHLFITLRGWRGHPCAPRPDRRVPHRRPASRLRLSVRCAAAARRS